MIIPGGAGVNYALEAGGNLETIVGLDFAEQTTLALIKAKTDNLDIALSTRALEAGGNLATLAGLDFAEQTTLALVKAKTDNLDIAVTALRDAICDATTPKDLKDIWDKLALLATEAGNLATLAGIDFALETGGNLATIAGVDFAEQTTLALIKAKTDNLDIAVTALRDAICGAGAGAKTLEALWDKLSGIEGLNTDIEQWTEFSKLNNQRMAGTFTNLFVVEMTTADTEYSQALTDASLQLTFLVREGTAFRYAWVTGKVATPTEPYILVPAGGAVCIENINCSSKTLYFACASAGKNMQIEVIG